MGREKGHILGNIMQGGEVRFKHGIDVQIRKSKNEIILKELAHRIG